MPNKKLAVHKSKNSLSVKRAKKKSDPSRIRVLSRALEILKIISKHPDGLTLHEIAHHTHLARSTVQRIVSTLDDANILIPVSPVSGVRLGPELTTLAASVKQFDIVATVRPLLVKLSKELTETVDLAVMGNGKAVVVDQILGTHLLAAVQSVGSSLSLHCSASGKALLATLDEEELAKLRKHYRLTPCTPNSIKNWNVLQAELDEVRRTGLAYDREEYLLGICSVAVPLRGPGGETAAVSVPIPRERFSGAEKALVRTLVERTSKIQRRFMR